MFTDDAIEVCIKKFVHFLRKGFIKIITNISCLKPGEKRLKDKKMNNGRFNLSDAKYEKHPQLLEGPPPHHTLGGAPSCL